MALTNWDPLGKSFSKELVDVTIKRQIKNILKSYTGWFDPFSELIQNALDAVDEREKSEKKYKPKIWIKINLRDNEICVTDNGIGFSEDEFEIFLAPNVSFKKPDDRGNKGVGATYLAYGFNFLQIGTKTKDFSYTGTLKGAREWVEEETTSKLRPKVKKSKPIHKIFEKIERGSTFTLRLTGSYIRPKDITWIGANTAEQWEIVLKIKTPLGGIYFSEDYSHPECYIEVVDKEGNTTKKTISDCEYIFPHKVIPTCKDLLSIQKKQNELIRKGKDPSLLPDSYHQLTGLYNFWDFDEIINEESGFGGFRLGEKEVELLKEYNISFYGFFCYSTEIWDELNDTVVGLREDFRILNGGLQLATNHMPQGEIITIPLKRYTGYQNVTHIIVHFCKADPDLGRKGFQPELVALAKKISVKICEIFQNHKRLLKKETGTRPDLEAMKEIYEWIRDQEEHERKSPLIITRKDVFLPTLEPSITSTPKNEQDVIALFNQLLAGGVIRGIKLLATDGYRQYDGVFRYFIKKPYKNHIFSIDENPLGIKDVLKEETESQPFIIEYKYSFNGLVEEIEKGEKNESEIRLVIAWEMGNKWESRYDVTSLLHFDNIHHRYFHGGTHIIKDTTTGNNIFDAIILSELVDYINDPEGVQDYQKTSYIK